MLSLFFPGSLTDHDCIVRYPDVAENVYLPVMGMLSSWFVFGCGTLAWIDLDQWQNFFRFEFRAIQLAFLIDYSFSLESLSFLCASPDC